LFCKAVLRSIILKENMSWKKEHFTSARCKKKLKFKNISFWKDSCDVFICSWMSNINRVSIEKALHPPCFYSEEVYMTNPRV
jgi:hypothetical protein